MVPATSLRKIIHVDMDAFYASVEQRDQPHYRGKPIVVGGTPEQRGAVAAASYEARKFGIRSAMPTRTALQRCPHLVIVKPRFDAYRQVSQQIRAIFQHYTDWVEPLSLDEAYLDVTQNKMGIASAVAIARQIQQQIWQETQLTASAGVSINKFLAKIASDINKPNGLYVILPEQADAFLDTLPIARFYGVGQVTAAKMQALGIHTGADLKQWAEADLVERFGKLGRYYYQVVRGQDNRPVNPDRIRQSIGAERTFETDLTDAKHMLESLEPIAQEVYQRLSQHQSGGYTLTLKLKYANYQQITRSRTVPTEIQTMAAILALAQELLQTYLQQQTEQQGDRPSSPTPAVRLLGISISNLTGTKPVASSSEPNLPIQLSLPLF
jgi:DNA polymerase IV